MEPKITAIIFFCIISGIVDASIPKPLELGYIYKENFGWEVTCSWNFRFNELLFVRLSYNQVNSKIEKALWKSRPYDGHHNKYYVFLKTETGGNITCTSTQINGTCVIGVAGNPNNELECEVFVPSNRNGKALKGYIKVIKPSVGPTDAVVNISKDAISGKVVLNCSSSGIPAPRIEWTNGQEEYIFIFMVMAESLEDLGRIGDLNRVSQQFEVSNLNVGSNWNTKTKLWDSWSVLYTDEYSNATCTPLYVDKENLSLRGKHVDYYSMKKLTSSASILDMTKLFFLLIPLIILK